VISDLESGIVELCVFARNIFPVPPNLQFGGNEHKHFQSNNQRRAGEFSARCFYMMKQKQESHYEK